MRRPYAISAISVIIVVLLAVGWFVWRRAAHPALQHGTCRGCNVLLVTLDTLRSDRVGAFGGPAGLTPELDRLAAGGVRFERAFSHVPLTLPAHASILTGQIPTSPRVTACTAMAASG